MKWYRKLYLGDNAKDAKYKTIGKVRTGKFQNNTYLITLAANPNNLLDIYSANFLLQPDFKKANVTEDVYVIGIAKGKEEAFEVVKNIISDVYTNTGGFEVKKYLGLGTKK